MAAINASMPGITLAVVGPKGCGKTTALAHLCQLLGGFDEGAVGECKNLAKELGNPQGELAWMLDRSLIEREVRATVDPAFITFQSSAFRYTAVDTPGETLLRSTVSAASLADIAVLVVSAATGEYEAAVESGRIRELCVACHNTGVKQFVVVVTKMDHAEFGMSRFDEIKKAVGDILKEVGYKQKDGKELPCVPISGLAGGNLVTKSPDMPWFGGAPLADTLDAQGPINRPSEKPLRLPVFKALEVPGVGTVAIGRVETGSVRTRAKVLFSPSGHVAEVCSLQLPGGHEISEAKTGDIVSAAIEGDGLEIRSGMVISAAGTSEDPAASAECFQAQIRLLDHPGSIRAGYCPSIAVGTAHVPCEFEELLTKLDKKGKEAEKNPPVAKAEDIILAKLRPRAPVCVEAFSAYPALGRFTIRDHGRTVGVGVVKEVEKRPIAKPRTGEENRYFDE